MFLWKETSLWKLINVYFHMVVFTLSFELNLVLMDFFNEMEIVKITDHFFVQLFSAVVFVFCFYFKNDKSSCIPSSCSNI